jgi:hypothetical protein
MHLITQVTSLDTSSMLLKHFPRSGFFNFGNKSKSGGLSPHYWFINNSDQLNMFRAMISPVFWSTRLCLQRVVYCTHDVAAGSLEAEASRLPAINIMGAIYHKL